MEVEKPGLELSLEMQAVVEIVHAEFAALTERVEEIAENGLAIPAELMESISQTQITRYDIGRYEPVVLEVKRLGDKLILEFSNYVEPPVRLEITSRGKKGI